MAFTPIQGNGPVTRIDWDGYNGQDGRPGSKGKDRLYSGHRGGDGKDGRNGKPGEDGSTINVSLAINNRQLEIRGTTDRDIALDDSCQEIFFSSRGGQGGNGGKGGNGGDGAPGTCGRDASRLQEADDGGPGGQGGNGGNGGDGGPGGKGGDIQINLSHHDMDTLMLLRQQPDMRGGKGGRGGQGGSGGFGGRGGSGGHGFSYYIPGSKGTNIYQSRHPGITGQRGDPGYPGYEGQGGERGRDGSVRITVDYGKYQACYSKPYSLKISDLKIENNKEDRRAFEPGEKLKLSVRVKNCGGMPTPTDQKVKLALREQQWIKPCHGQESELPTEIPIGEYAWTNESIAFTIPDHCKPSRAAPLNEKTEIRLRSVMERVGQGFKKIDRKRVQVTIRHGAKIEVLALTKGVPEGGQAPIAIRVTNVSHKALGSTHGRGLRIGLSHDPQAEVRGGKNILLKAKTGEEASASDGLFWNLDHLEVGESRFFSATATFSNPDLPYFTTAPLIGSLDLGAPVPSPGVSYLDRRIQEIPFQIQKAKAFEFHGNEDVLLITNSTSTEDEVETWKDFFQSSGLQASVWNSSLYGAVSLNHFPEGSDLPLKELFRNKTVVCLPGPNGQPEEHLPAQEFLSLGLEQGINIYHLGPAFGLEMLAIPNRDACPKEGKTLDSQEDVVKHALECTLACPLSYLPNRRAWCVGPLPKKALQKEAESLRQELIHQYPDQSFLVVHSKKGAQDMDYVGCCGAYTTGEITVLRSGDRLHPHIFQSTPTYGEHHADFVQDPHNVFLFFRALPLKTKMSILPFVAKDSVKAQGMERALVAEFVEEVQAFRGPTWMWNMRKKYLKQQMTSLGALPSIQGPSDEESQNLLARVCAKLLILADRLDGTWGWLPFHRGANLATRLEKGAQAMIKNYDLENMVKDEKNTLSDSFDSYSTEEVMEMLTNPCNLHQERQSNLHEHLPLLSERELQNLQLPPSPEGKKLSLTSAFKSEEERVAALEELEKEFHLRYSSPMS